MNKKSKIFYCYKAKFYIFEMLIKFKNQIL